MALLAEAFTLGTAPPALPAARLSRKLGTAAHGAPQGMPSSSLAAAATVFVAGVVAKRRATDTRAAAVAMRAKRKVKGGKKGAGNVAAKQKALQALQSLELAQKQEQEAAAAKKEARQKKNGRDAAPVATAVNGKNGTTEAVQTIEKPKAEESPKEAEPPKNGKAKVTTEVSNGANGKSEVTTAAHEEPAKLEEKEPVQEPAKLEEKEPVQEPVKMEDEEPAQEPTEAEEPEVTEEEVVSKEVVEKEVVAKEEPEDMKDAEEVVEKMKDLEKAAAAPAAQKQAEAVDAPPAPAKNSFADILSDVDWDNVDNPGNRDPDPISEIGVIFAKAADENRKKQGKKKEIGGPTKELDRDAYFRKNGVDPRLGGTVDAELEDWADDPNYYPEEEEEEPVMIKRKRGADDQVDWSFLQKGEVEGEVTVGIREVAVRLGGRQVLQDASWTVKTEEKLALVGANGCGKTTQLRVLLNQLTPEKGEVVKSPANAKVAILEQSFVDELDPERTLKEELLSALPEQKAILDEKAEVTKALEANPEDPQEQMRLVDRLTELTTLEEEYGTYKLDDQLATIKKMAGFLSEDLDRKVGLFSGGWKVRIGVSKLFMSNPDILLLDEPTNHLDLEAVEWIESFIRALQNPVVVVTHDREFMNRTCNRVVETVEGMTYSYEGNYTEFIKQKEQKMILWQKKFDLQEKKRKELQDFIKQNRGVQSLANTRQKRMKELEELTKNGIDPPPAFIKRISFRFPEPEKTYRGGAKWDILAELKDVCHGYGDDEKADEYDLLENCDFQVGPGDKIGIIGGNGKGKSTLLRILMGLEEPSKGGTVRPADPDMTGFFAQHQADLLPMDKTGWQIVKEANEILMDDRELQEIMKKFRFRGDRMHVKVESLSGGEKARLAIVRMMLIPSRMLIFDEPTNHLDVRMKETLEFALREYGGAVVIVSHDRWFLSQTCKKIVEIKDGDVKTYDGDFRYYMDMNQDVRTKIESHYTGIDGLIDSVPATLAEKKKKERKGLRKNQSAKWKQERLQQMQASFLSRRT